MNHLILLAAGSGTRLGYDVPKAFVKINDKVLFELSLTSFISSMAIDDVILMVPQGYIEKAKEICQKYPFKIDVLEGGKTRQESVYKGLKFLENIANKKDLVFIHDSARPLIGIDDIHALFKASVTKEAVVFAQQVSDTILVLDNDKITFIPDRKTLFKEETPACFNFSLVLKAHELALLEGINDASDDCSLVKKISDVYIIPGNERLFKVTYKEDLERLINLVAK